MDHHSLMVTGAGGFVAGSVIEQARGLWHVCALARRPLPPSPSSPRAHIFDLRDSAKLAAAFAEARPAAVIHTAAMADIDACQARPQEAEAINVGATRALAELCRASGAKLVFCSTDSVFDGRRGMYSEADAPRAVNRYAETKLRAEAIVRETVPNSVVARLALVLGLPVLGAGNSFLARTLASLAAGQAVKFPENEIRTPIDVLTAGRALLELARGDFTGVLHLAGNTRVTRYEMARQIAARLGFGPELIVPVDSNAMPGRAPRPNDVSLDNAQARRVLRTPMRGLMDGLEAVLAFQEARRDE